MLRLKSLTAGLLAFSISALHGLAEKPMGLQLPTPNNYIFSDTPQKFYMYTYRNFEGVSSKPWTAGKYGHVRTLRRTDAGVIGTKFHEGIDISPVKRDSAGRPLDLIKSIADGVVVHTSQNSGASNYGRYIVVEHDWGSGKFYSLYAHLDTINIKVGQQVNAGTVIAKMGYTGAGINRERAHLHLELGVLGHRSFEDWYASNFTSPNRHGIFHGFNLSGLDVSEALIRSNKSKGLTMSQFIKTIPTHFKVTVPRKDELDLVLRYPWLKKGNHQTASPSWEMSFDSSGFPLSVAPSMREVSRPTVSYVKPSKTNHSYQTKGLISGTGTDAKLTARGLRTVSLYTGEFPRKARVIKPNVNR